MESQAPMPAITLHCPPSVAAGSARRAVSLPLRGATWGAADKLRLDTPLVDPCAARQPLEYVWAGGALRPADRGDPTVFVPRRRTPSSSAGRRAGPAGGRDRGPVLRLGCLAAALTAAVPRAGVHAADIDRRRCAPPGATWPPGRAGVPGRPAGPLRPGWAAGWTSCWRRRRATSEVGLLPPEGRDHEARWPWTAARTAWTCCGARWRGAGVAGIRRASAVQDQRAQVDAATAAVTAAG